LFYRIKKNDERLTSPKRAPESILLLAKLKHISQTFAAFERRGHNTPGAFVETHR
jgi:hypothetical protein